MEILHIDMDNVIANYDKRWYQVKTMLPEVEYPQSLDGFFLNIEPIAEGIEAVNLLRNKFDTYILSAPSYMNPLSYTEKRKWIEKHFDLEFSRRLILSCYKNLLKGDFLIDDRMHDFSGELILYGSDTFPDWNSILNYLL